MYARCRSCCFQKMEETNNYNCKIHVHDLHKEKKQKLINDARLEVMEGIYSSAFPSSSISALNEVDLFTPLLSRPSIFVHRCPSCEKKIMSAGSNFWVHLSKCDPSNYHHHLLNLQLDQPEVKKKKKNSITKKNFFFYFFFYFFFFLI